MTSLGLRADKAWAGIFGGVLCWYGAHEIGIYLSDYSCRHQWVLPFVHLVALVACVWFARMSYLAWPKGHDPADEERSLRAGVNFAAASLFSLVIFWQGVATLVYSGCER